MEEILYAVFSINDVIMYQITQQQWLGNALYIIIITVIVDGYLGEWKL